MVMTTQIVFANSQLPMTIFILQINMLIIKVFPTNPQQFLSLQISQCIPIGKTIMFRQSMFFFFLQVTISMFFKGAILFSINQIISIYKWVNIFKIGPKSSVQLNVLITIIIKDLFNLSTQIWLQFITTTQQIQLHQQKKSMQSEKSQQLTPSTQSLRVFGLSLLVIEVIIIILFGIFVRMETHHISDALQSQRYAAFQDINVMMLIGFGFLMTFIRTHSWSALSYTFFINAIIVQIYILFKAFWERVFHGFQNVGTYIKLDQILFTESSYAVASVLIAFGGIIGRVGPKELLLMGLIQMIGYTLNEVVVLQLIGCFDAGGSMTIHSFGAYFGLTVSLILSKKITPISKPQSNYLSNIFSMIGTLFLWMFWPSFNFGVFSQTIFEQNQIIANTLLSLTGSCLATFIFSSLLGHGIEMQDILNATLAGGVAIGSSCGVLYYPGVALAIGFMAGIISVFGFRYLSPKLQQKIGLFDSCGIHNLHGIPGVYGGIWSSIIIAFYNTGYDSEVAVNYGSQGVFNKYRESFLNQGGLQIAGTFTSVGMGIGFGIVAGYLISLFYKQKVNMFFKDSQYFQHASVQSEKEETNLKENQNSYNKTQSALINNPEIKC